MKMNKLKMLTQQLIPLQKVFYNYICMCLQKYKYKDAPWAIVFHGNITKKENWKPISKGFINKLWYNYATFKKNEVDMVILKYKDKQNAKE